MRRRWAAIHGGGGVVCICVERTVKGNRLITLLEEVFQRHHDGGYVLEKYKRKEGAKTMGLKSTKKRGKESKGNKM